MEFNWLSQILASISALAIGFVWYGVVFGKAWQKEAGLTLENIKDGYHPAVLYGLAFILAFVLSIGIHQQIIGLHQAFDSVSEHPFFHGAYHGLWDAFIFGGITMLVTNALFDQKSWKYIAINAGYWLVTMAVMGGIIGVIG